MQSENFESIDAFTKAFDSLVKPVIWYGAEVWGIDEIINMKKRDSLNMLNNVTVYEKVHTTFCKQILRVTKHLQT